MSACIRAIIVFFFFSLTDCALILPARRVSRREAAKREERQFCGAEPMQIQTEIISPQVIQSVEPFYSIVSTGRTGEESRLQGARLLIRPLEGLGVERLESLLRCHAARENLSQGNREAVMDDPYLLPDALVDIQVESGRGNFVVYLRGHDVQEAHLIFARACRFTATRNPFN